MTLVSWISDGPIVANPSSLQATTVVHVVSSTWSTVSNAEPCVSICSEATGTGRIRPYATSDAVELAQPGISSLALPTVVPVVTFCVIATAGSCSVEQNTSLVPDAAL